MSTTPTRLTETAQNGRIDERFIERDKPTTAGMTPAWVPDQRERARVRPFRLFVRLKTKIFSWPSTSCVLGDDLYLTLLYVLWQVSLVWSLPCACVRVLETVQSLGAYLNTHTQAVGKQ